MQPDWALRRTEHLERRWVVPRLGQFIVAAPAFAGLTLDELSVLPRVPSCVSCGAARRCLRRGDASDAL